MSVSDFVRQQLHQRLEQHRIVVWYDSDRAFADFIQSFQADSCVIVSTVESILNSRRQAEAVYRQMNEPDNLAKAGLNLLIYVPRQRGIIEDEKRQDPFEVFAWAGVAFGDKEAEQLESLARQAIPERSIEITRLFAQGSPTLSMLDKLQFHHRSPLLLEALDTDSPSEAIALVLCLDEKSQRIDSVKGCLKEFLQLLATEIGFKPLSKANSWTEIRKQLGQYVLFNEFALDLPCDLPESFSALSRAEASHELVIFAVCDRMRDSSDLRSGYVQLAVQVENQLQLSNLTENLAQLGTRDTFPFAEKRYLHQVLEYVQQNNLADAQRILTQRRHSIWNNHLERGNIWMIVERCVTFLATSNAVKELSKKSLQSMSLRQIISAYAPPDRWGWAELDRHQRLFEQGATAYAGDGGEIESLVEFCRRRYLEVALAIQDRFLNCVQKEGWFPEGVLRQTQVFDQYVAPLLEQNNNKVAFFLADSLRFEMGRDLAEALEQLGEVETLPVASVLPTTTPCGMAALMPNADGTLRLVESDGELIPVLGERKLEESRHRMRLLQEKYGDRFKDIEPEDILSKKVNALGKQLASVDLLVVRTKDPDRIAESIGNMKARKYLSDVVSEMVNTIRRLSRIGFTHFVISADHGHVLIDEIPLGDVIPKPGGEWLKTKRRSLLGQFISGESPNTIIFKTEQVGIQGDAQDLCVAKGFKVFQQVEGYFHEGISLQEAIVPLVILRSQGKITTQSKPNIFLRYKFNYFTSKVINLRVCYEYLLPEPIQVRIEAYDGSTIKAKRVGEATDCDARDERTGEIILQPNQEISVPILLESDDISCSKIELRAIDPQTGVIWAKLELENRLLD